MRPDICVRSATAADLDFILALVPTFVDFGLPVGREPAAHAACFAELLTKAVSGGGAVYVAEAPDRSPLGFVHLAAGTDLTGRPRTEVADVAVAPTAQGRSVGQVLIEFAERWAAERGHDRVALTAFTTNRRALRFYERLGDEPETVVLSKPVSAAPPP